MGSYQRIVFFGFKLHNELGTYVRSVKFRDTNWFSTPQKEPCSGFAAHTRTQAGMKRARRAAGQRYALSGR